ncbi:hypothetical protein JHK82_043693 [Glycine max]|nr:hypothetical protein JHK86_043570 [Glycine max]KAG5106723.1 hypothetical protein JHK82_043693 [Glycine max]KAG5117644.1 hypothetical protein JHK84_043757 [Glycine max]
MTKGLEREYFSVRKRFYFTLVNYGGQTMEASCTTEFVEPVVTIGFVQKSMVLCFFRRKISRNCTSQFSSFPKDLLVLNVSKCLDGQKSVSSLIM